jgi:predicted nucleic acid-binding protein
VVSEFVVDASAAISALGREDAVGIATYHRIVESTCHAPHLLDAEVGHVLRRSERAGEITDIHARTALAALPRIVEYRYPHTDRLATLAWELRHTVTFYDGLYVALATVLNVPLLTADLKLNKAPGLSCAVEVVC